MNERQQVRPVNETSQLGSDSCHQLLHLQYTVLQDTSTVHILERIFIFPFLIKIDFGVSQVVQRSKALHRSARGITTDLGSIQGCITTGCDRESNRAAHNWPSVVRVRGTLLGSSCSSNSLWRARHLQAYLSRQLNGVTSDTVWLASGLSGQVFRRMNDSTFASRACWGVAAMRQDRKGG